MKQYASCSIYEYISYILCMRNWNNTTGEPLTFEIKSNYFHLRLRWPN